MTLWFMLNLLHRRQETKNNERSQERDQEQLPQHGAQRVPCHSSQRCRLWRGLSAKNSCWRKNKRLRHKAGARHWQGRDRGQRTYEKDKAKNLPSETQDFGTLGLQNLTET